jgi:hypothetical protein
MVLPQPCRLSSLWSFCGRLCGLSWDICLRLRCVVWGETRHAASRTGGVALMELWYTRYLAELMWYRIRMSYYATYGYDLWPSLPETWRQTY